MDIKPYVDPILQDRGQMLGLIHRLAQRALVTFRLVKRLGVGVFTVIKKGDLLRLIFDCRVTNACCYDPPKTMLTTPAALSNLRIRPSNCP